VSRNPADSFLHRHAFTIGTLIGILVMATFAAHGATPTWSVTEPQWKLDANGSSYPTESACTQAAEALTPATYHCTYSGVATIVGTAGSTSSVPPFWVYYNGVFSWGGDYSFGLPQGSSPNYQDTSGKPLSGAYDISITTNAYGGFLPFAGGTVPLWNFDASPYSKLTFALKPTHAGQKWQVYVIMVGDKKLPDSCTVTAAELLNYGPVPAVGVWGTYTIDFSALCLGPKATGGTSLYKVAIQDQTGLQGNLWYVDNFGFLP